MIFANESPKSSLTTLSLNAIAVLLATVLSIVLIFLAVWLQGMHPAMPEMMSAHASHHSLPFIAVGIVPMGTIALGVVPMGIVAIGIVPMGVFSLGFVAMGALAAGLQTMGLISIGSMGMGNIRITAEGKRQEARGKSQTQED